MEIIKHQVGGNRKDYNKIYSAAGISQMDSFFIWVLRLAKVNGGRLLDVSCGEGQLLRWAQTCATNAYGVDISDVAASIAQAKSNRPTVVGDAQDLPFVSDSFDYVFNNGSLEHYEDMERGVSEMARVLRQGGTACVHLPNSYGKRWNVQHVWRTGDIHDDGQPIQRYATRGEWQRLLETGGFKVQRVVGYEYMRETPYTWSDALTYLRRPQRILSTIYQRLTIPVNAASILIYILSKP